MAKVTKKSVVRKGAVARKAVAKKTATKPAAKRGRPAGKAKTPAVKPVEKTRGAIDSSLAGAQLVIANGKVVKDNLGLKKSAEVRALLAMIKELKSAA
jgi:hypothetical protein